jgi:hypothetical protein
MSLEDIKQVRCQGFRWNYNDVDVDITWGFYVEEHQYFSILISSDVSFGTTIELFIQSGLNMVELYLGSLPKWIGSSYTMKNDHIFISIPKYTRMARQTSQSSSPFRITRSRLNSYANF